jgi:DNA-nicking Smr family endonuclease
MRRKPSLSDEDIALWASVASKVHPLPGRKRPVAPAAFALLLPAIAPLAPAIATPAPAPPATKPLVPLERRLKQRLRRGQEDIGGVLDLHGLRQDEAHRALLLFIQRKHHDSTGVVLIITGKGSLSPQGEERGVLRRLVPHWLADPGLRRCVLGYENAADGHGGSGALYVRLRKRRAE